MTTLKLKIPALALLGIFGMMTLVVYAEHSTLGLELSDEKKEHLQKYFDLMDAFFLLDTVIYKDKTDEEILKIARDRVTENFKDPDSAKFRNERIVRRKIHSRVEELAEVVEEDGTYVCGEVNGKNSYGAYAGYRDYFGGSFLVAIEGNDDQRFPYAMFHYCNRE